MKRVAVAIVVLAMALAPLAGIATGLSSPDTTSTDLDVMFVDSNNNLKYTDANGNVVDTGVQALSVGGSGDYDNDGDVDVIYQTTGDNIGYIDTNGNVATIDLAEPIQAVGAVVNFDGDYNQEALVVGQDGVLRTVESGGGSTYLGYDNASPVGDAADLNGDGEIEVTVTNSGGDLVYVQADGGSGVITTTSLRDVGATIDSDGDGTPEAHFSTLSDTLVRAEFGGSTTTLVASDVDRVGGGGDFDADGNEEVAYTEVADNTIAIAGAGGKEIDTGVAASDIGAVVDFDGDSGYDNAPTAANASPNSTTTSADPVTLSVDVDDSEFVMGDSVTVDIDHNGNNITETTISSAQTVTADVQDVPNGANSWSVTVTDSNGNSNSYTYSYTGDYAAPQLSNAQPSGNTSSYSGEVSVNVTDGDFDNSSNDVVTVTASEGGTQIGSTRVSSNTTVRFDYSVLTGTQTINWSATDSHANTDTLSQQFTVQSDLIIRNETDTGQLVASPTVVEATFFGNNITVTKSDSDGTISFDGLPADQPFIVEVSADGYRDRTIYVPSLLQQQTVYLLPENASSVQVRFQLKDASGTFSERSVLYIEKPINDGGNVSYQIIASDRFGAAGVTTYLEKNVRYNLRVVSERGDVAQIGNYGATLNETVVLEPSVASISDPEGSSDAIQYDARYRNSTQEILIEYVDPAGRTDEVTVRVVKDDGTIIKPNQTYYSSQTLSLSVPTNGQLNQTAYVYLNGTRGNETFGAQVPVGPQQQDITPDNLSGVWVQIGAGAVILMVGGVFSALNVGIGAAITSLFAGVLWWLGIMSGLASGAAIALAIGLSTLNLLLNR